MKFSHAIFVIDFKTRIIFNLSFSHLFLMFLYFFRSHVHLIGESLTNCFILRRRFFDRTKHSKYINLIEFVATQ